MADAATGDADRSLARRATEVRADPTWERLQDMPGPVATEFAALEMTAHAVVRAKRRAWVMAPAVALIAIAAFVATGDLVAAAGAAAVGSLTMLLLTRTDWLRPYGQAHALLAGHDVPVGRLRVLCVALLGAPRGRFGWSDFAAVLHRGGSELSCAALGYHVDGLCPHRRGTPPTEG